MYITWHAAVYSHVALSIGSIYHLSQTTTRPAAASYFEFKKKSLTVKNGHIIMATWWHLMCIFLLCRDF